MRLHATGVVSLASNYELVIMIEDAPSLQIRRAFVRPTAAQIAAFCGVQTGYVVDAMNGRGALDGRIKPIGTANAFCGSALPCYAGPADNLAAFGALSVAQSGDVVICATDFKLWNCGYRRFAARYDEKRRGSRICDGRVCS